MTLLSGNVGDSSNVSRDPITYRRGNIGKLNRHNEDQENKEQEEEVSLLTGREVVIWINNKIREGRRAVNQYNRKLQRKRGEELRIRISVRSMVISFKIIHQGAGSCVLCWKRRQ